MAQFHYPLMEPPVRFPPCETMSEAIALQHFNWFVGKSKERVNMLLRAYASDCAAGPPLHFRAESLVPLWEWASRYVEYEREERTATRRAAEPLPEWAIAAAIRHRELAAGTLALGVDIGFYIAEVFMRNYSNVAWELWKKTKDYYYNRPVLVGFGYPLVPHNLSLASFGGVLHGKYDKEQLLRVFRRWEKLLSEGKTGVRGKLVDNCENWGHED